MCVVKETGLFWRQPRLCASQLRLLVREARQRNHSCQGKTILVGNPANDSEPATQVISMLMVHKSYVAAATSEPLEKRRDVFKNLPSPVAQLWITMTWWNETLHGQYLQRPCDLYFCPVLDRFWSKQQHIYIQSQTVPTSHGCYCSDTCSLFFFFVFFFSAGLFLFAALPAGGVSSVAPSSGVSVK